MGFFSIPLSFFSHFLCCFGRSLFIFWTLVNRYLYHRRLKTFIRFLNKAIGIRGAMHLLLDNTPIYIYIFAFFFYVNPNKERGCAGEPNKIFGRPWFHLPAEGKGK